MNHVVYIQCQNCGSSAMIPGRKEGIRCDSCNAKYWGYNNMLSTPMPSFFRYHILKQKGRLSELEKTWFDNYRPIDQSELGKICAWFVSLSTGRLSIDYPIYEGKNYIGRASNEFRPNIAIDHEYISRYHALLTVKSNFKGEYDYLLTDNIHNIPPQQSGNFHRDFQSSNGCYINDQEDRLKSNNDWKLYNGDLIHLGGYGLLFVTNETLEEIKKEDTIQLINNKIADETTGEVTSEIPDFRTNTVPGWLIINTEQKDNKSFPLKTGANIIGREHLGNELDIAIEEDSYISRYHAVLKVSSKPDGSYQYLLFDNDDKPSGRTSKYGCFRNGSPERLSENIYWELKDGDTIQIGLTKLVLMTTNDNKTAIIEVAKKGFENTVHIRK